MEQDFDLAKEQRRSRVGWVLAGGLLLSVIYLFLGRPFAVEVFQGCVATVLCYGANFYVDRKKYLSKLWLWKAIIATVPLHTAYLAILFWSDKAFPNVMTKAIVFMPVLLLVFAIEVILIDRIVDHFKPPST